MRHPFLPLVLTLLALCQFGMTQNILPDGSTKAPPLITPNPAMIRSLPPPQVGVTKVNGINPDGSLGSQSTGGNSSVGMDQPAVTARFDYYGAGCRGTGTGCYGPGMICTSLNGTAMAHMNRSMATNADFVIALTASSARSISGFQMLIKRSSDGSTPAYLFADNGAGKPAITPVRTGMLTFNANSGWSTVTFSRPYMVSLSQKYYLGFHNPNPTVQAISTSTTRGTHFWRTSPTASWSGPFSSQAWTVRVICGTNAILSGNGEARANGSTTFVTNAQFLVRCTAETNSLISGFEILTKSSMPGQTKAYLYRADAAGKPTTLLRTGVIRFSPHTSWQTCRFHSPYSFAQGSRFFIGILNPTNSLRLTASSGSKHTHFWRTSSAASWSGPFTTQNWVFRVNADQFYCDSLNSTQTANGAGSYVVNGTFAITETATISRSITGYELLVKSTAAGSTPAFLWMVDNTTGKPTTLLRTSTLTYGIGSTWARVLFPSSYTFTAGSRYAVGFRNPGPTLHPALTSGSNVTYCYRPPTAASWNGPFAASAIWGYRILCRTSSNPCAPTLGNTGLPKLGNLYRVNLNFARPSMGGAHFLGVSRTNYSGLPLPFRLGFMGASGCSLYTNIVLISAVTTNSRGSATVGWAIPNINVLEGAHLYHQFFIIDPSANPVGLTSTNGGDARLGL